MDEASGRRLGMHMKASGNIQNAPGRHPEASGQHPEAQEGTPEALKQQEAPGGLGGKMCQNHNVFVSKIARATVSRAQELYIYKDEIIRLSPYTRNN